MYFIQGLVTVNRVVCFIFFINVYRMNTYQCCKILMLFKI